MTNTSTSLFLKMKGKVMLSSEIAGNNINDTSAAQAEHFQLIRLFVSLTGNVLNYQTE